MVMFSKLITPKSIAVIGASNNPEKIGYQILSNLVENDFSGDIFPINPKGGEILSKKVYENVSSISSQIDLAIICIPSGHVVDVLKECAEKNVKAVIVITAGFSETGTDGENLQEEISHICEESGITMLGPNCLGLINTDIGLNASFAASMPKKGNVSLISQSGAMISALIDWSNSSSVGFSKIFSLGNKAMLKEEDILEYLYNDKTTDVIISYLENLQVTSKLTNVLIEYAKTKPTIVLFGGKSSAGAKAAASHTGSLVSSYLAVETYLKQAGVIVADTLEDLFAYSTLFSKYQEISGGKIAIITNAGGPSIAASDAIIKNGLEMASIDDEILGKLKSALRPEAALHNPIDVLGDANETEYKNAIDVIKTDKNVDGILVLLTPQSSTKVIETAEIIVATQTKKPMICAFVGGESLVQAKELINASDKICFDYPEDATKAFAALNYFSNDDASLEEPLLLNGEYIESEKDRLLKDFDLPVLEYIEVSTNNEAIIAADRIGFPVVIKTAKKEISHKSDAGGVKLDIKNEAELTDALGVIGFPAIIGKMIKGKHEIFLGVKKDSNIGTVVAFGSGGIYSELYKDLSYRVAPVSKSEAKKMIYETKMGEILSGARGQKQYDLNKLAEIIVNTAKFADNFSNIIELDFNPIIADSENFYLVDARIIESGTC